MPEVLGDLDELLAVIRRTAQQKALNEVAEAQQRAERILQQAQAEAQRIREDTLARARKQAAQERRRRLAQAALEVQHRRLEAREALLNRVWAEAERRLRALPAQPDYPAVLQRLAYLAAGILGTGRITLAADPQGHAALTPERLAAWSQEAGVTFERAPQPADTWGGLIAVHEDGRRQVDATFPTRLELAREELRERVAQALEVT